MAGRVPSKTSGMKLPAIPGEEAVRTFQKLGYEFGRQHGSHIRADTDYACDPWTEA
jgi:hypothetical protein